MTTAESVDLADQVAIPTGYLDHVEDQTYSCDTCGTCCAHSGCADDANPVDLAAGDCADCGACADCIQECDTDRAPLAGSK